METRGRKDAMSTKFLSNFSFRDRVTIDADASITGVVSGFAWSTDEGETIKVNWMHNGTSQVAWFEMAGV